MKRGWREVEGGHRQMEEENKRQREEREVKGRWKERGKCSRGEVAGGAEGRVNSAPTRRFGRSEPGTEGSTPLPLPTLPPNPARSAQLCRPDSFRLLCARRLFGFPSLA